MQLCDRVAAHRDFSINMYGMDRPLCSHWVFISGFDAQKAVAFYQRFIGTQTIAVARKRTNSALYPGKYMHFNKFRIIIALDENIIVSDKQGEVLHVDPACIWRWIPYTSPNSLPVGALVAGYNIEGEHLYVARAIFDDVYSIGYYKSSTSLGYFMIFGEVRTATVMDILIIL